MSRSEYGTSVKCDYNPNGLPVLRIPNIAKGEIDLSDMKRATKTVAMDSERALQKGDLLMCRTNGSIHLVGKTALVGQQFDVHHGFASYLLRFRLVDATTSARWFHVYSTSRYGRAFIEQNAASSAGQNNVSLTLIHRMPLPIPPQAEQHRILDEVERLLSVIQQAEATVQANLGRAERLRQSILKQAFSGQLVPQDPSDEPASALLERIRDEREAAKAQAVKTPPRTRRRAKPGPRR